MADAREKVREARKQVSAGTNPITAKREAKAADASKRTFGAVADAMLEARAGEWRSARHRAQWRAALENMAGPLRDLLVDEINTAAVLEVLKPLWSTKPETASRLRGRIEAVLDAAKARGLRTGENPAAWRGHLAHLLPRRGRLARGHHAAMDYQLVPDFIAKLRADPNMAARALEFCILTAGRSSEVYGARWAEIDLDTGVWSIPKNRMKAGRPHRVPLVGRALTIARDLSDLRTCDFVFPSPRGKRPLSHVAMAKVLRKLGEDTATVHGFRSAFRDWAGNETSFPREVAEAALAHTTGDSAEQAYRRGDALEKRRKLMEAWGAYVGSQKSGSTVVAMSRRRHSDG